MTCVVVVVVVVYIVLERTYALANMRRHIHPIAYFPIFVTTIAFS